MFRDMKSKSEKKEVKNNLTNVLHKVAQLRDKYLSENKVWKELQTIDLVKVSIKRISCLDCEMCTFLVVDLLFMI